MESLGGSYTAAEWSGIISKFTEGEPIDAANIKVGTAAADKVAFVGAGSYWRLRCVYAG